MVSLAVPILLLHPWLKADVAAAGMDFSEAVCKSSSPLEQGVSKEPQLFSGSAAWRHSNFSFFLQFFAGSKPDGSKSIAPRCCGSSLPGEAASAQVVWEASKTFEGQKCACLDVSESEVAGTDGLSKRSWSCRLVPWSVRRAW